MLRRPAIWGLALGACSRPGPLANAPIIGADAAYEARIREAVREFERATGEGRVFVNKILVREGDGYDGRWRPRSGVVEIAPELDDEDLTATVRHELCHALDYEEGPFHLDHPRLYEELALQDPFATMGAASIGCDDTVTCAAREVFASMCEFGPAAAHAYRTPCQGENPQHADLMAHLGSAVWRGEHVLATVTRGPMVAEYLLENPHLDGYSATGMVDPSVVRLNFHRIDSGIDRHTAVHVDVLTGAYVGDLYELEDLTRLRAPENVPSGAPLRVLPASNWVGWEEGGPASGTSRVDFYHFGELDRQVWTDGEGGWAVVDDGCVMEPPPFTGDGSILALERTPETLAWRRVDWGF